ncbi:ABC transporter ATP-binding protein [Candidatus Bipolaricaulota bacterium]|nr:ABC transporter ATP-binding protein [Candidatus Bipolaricaulota bacterium]
MDSDPLIRMEGITKRFPGVLANDSVDLSIQEGEIHALVGENGAGKTTLMKILYGIYSKDGGQIFFEDELVNIEDPKDANNLGIGMVHQHFMLVPPLSVVDNITLGSEIAHRGVLDREEGKRRIQELANDIGFEIDPEAKIEDLSVGVRQRIEILKVLFREAEVLILDEPTAVLTPQEVESLYEILNNLQEQGKTIIFITHKLNEVMDISDRVTVMRDGKEVGTKEIEDTSKKELANMMVGREVLLRVEKEEPELGEELIRAENLTVTNDEGVELVSNVSFSIREGEVFGIAGVQGNGQTELIEALTGIDKFSSGTVEVQDSDLTNVDGKRIREEGVGHIPEDRLDRGMITDFTVTENFVLGYHTFERYSNRLFMKLRNMDKHAEEAVEEFDIKTPSTKTLAESLSGGNQQKLIVARELSQQPKLLIAAQPTRGIDVGAIEFVHKRLMEERAKGKGLLLVSSELDEIVSLSDRIAVIYEGEFTGMFDADEISKEELGVYMTGSKRQDKEEVRRKALGKVTLQE